MFFLNHESPYPPNWYKQPIVICDRFGYTRKSSVGQPLLMREACYVLRATCYVLRATCYVICLHKTHFPEQPTLSPCHPITLSPCLLSSCPLPSVLCPRSSHRPTSPGRPSG